MPKIDPAHIYRQMLYCDCYLYKERHLVECFFNKLKENQQIATRFDKRALVVYGFCLHDYADVLNLETHSR